MANTTMMFPNTVREFMEQYKMVDTEHIYSNGIEYVPIFRMEQWFAHHNCPLSAEPQRKKGEWNYTDDMYETYKCSECGFNTYDYIEYNFCPNCGADMRGEQDE